ncbi:MAG TPA: PQQ-dependent sugar dehydrogenase [Solirubrobacterales bacterium]|nr:PQQ-dependent sugar dehydrogenase [Solirubrobacterales bacterium]
MSTLIRGGAKLGVALALLVGASSSSAQALTLQQVGPSFANPIYVTSDPVDPERLFVVEREGTIRLVENGESKLFADIRSLVSCCTSEQGLQSIALSPDFAQSGRFFLFYTGEEEPGEIHVAEMHAVGDFASTATLRNLLMIPHPGHANHYGGQLQFGSEGSLFISTGDGGGSNDEEENAQDLGSLLGKLLRIDPDPEGLLPYGIPAGNPFASTPGAKPEIWSLGLRNPFRFSFDRQTGDLWIGDVGQAKREEVDFAPAPWMGTGANYGWNCYEGLEKGPFTDPTCVGSEPSDFVFPVFDYENPPEPGSCAAIIGGYVARGPGYGDLFGRYLYADLCAGDLRSFSPADPFATDRAEGVNVGSLHSFGEDSCGRLYAVSGDGPVYRILGPEAAICPGPAQALSPSFVRIRALSRRVKRNRRAFISAWVSPCNGRRGQPVTLWRGRQRIGTRRLDRVCSVRFRPRIRHRVRFRARVPADATYAEAVSRRLHILILRRHRAR